MFSGRVVAGTAVAAALLVVVLLVSGVIGGSGTSKPDKGAKAATTPVSRTATEATTTPAGTPVPAPADTTVAVLNGTHVTGPGPAGGRQAPQPAATRSAPRPTPPTRPSRPRGRLRRRLQGVRAQASPRRWASSPARSSRSTPAPARSPARRPAWSSRWASTRPSSRRPDSCPAPLPQRQAARSGAHPRARQRAVGRPGRRAGRGRRRLRRHRQARLGHGPGHPEPRGQARPLPRPRHPGRARRHADRGGDPPGPHRRARRPGCARYGLGHIEISDGSIDARARAQARAHPRASPARASSSSPRSAPRTTRRSWRPTAWVEQIQAELEAGAWKVIAEARESGTAGIFRPDGEVRMGLIDEIAHAVDFERVMFEAPQKDQQVWFLRRFGSETQPRQHRAGRRARPRDAAPRPALRHDRHRRRVIWLARHGETAYNAERRFQGQGPVGLSDRGREQARELAERGRRPRVRRAVVQPAAAGPRDRRDRRRASSAWRPREDPRLMETDTGDWTDRPFAEVEAADPERFAAWVAGAPDFAFPGGESFAAQQERVVRRAGGHPRDRAAAGARRLPPQHDAPRARARPAGAASRSTRSPTARWSRCDAPRRASSSPRWWPPRSPRSSSPSASSTRSTALQEVRGARVFSPNGDGRARPARGLVQAQAGRRRSRSTSSTTPTTPSRALVTDRHVGRQRRTRVTLGRPHRGRPRARPTGSTGCGWRCDGEGRTVVVRRRYRLDTTPPRPLVAVDRPARRPRPGAAAQPPSAAS